MNVEELSALTVAELRERANVALDGVSGMSPMERQHHLVEAQFYIDEIERRAERQERKETSRVATRDLVLEIVVIVLIGIEIVLGWQSIQAGAAENGKQMEILNALKTSVDSLNTSTNRTANNIEILSKAQTEALKTQENSLGTMSKINTAMQGQLDILREDQKQRLAELAKKPALRLLSNGTALDLPFPHNVFPKYMDATSGTFEFVLNNAGDATARSFSVYFGTPDKEVTLSAENSFGRLLVPSDVNNLVNGIQIGVPVLSANGLLAIVLKLQYPAGKKSFNLQAWANGENVPNMSLGSVNVVVPAFPVGTPK